MPNEPIETVGNENEELNENISETNSEIEQCLEQFRTAKLGEEVRSALIRAIELCYKDVIEQIRQHGIQGYSAYELAQSQGYTGTLSQWLDSLKGDPGETGPQGPAGNDGVVTIEDLQIAIDNDLDSNSQNPVKNSTLYTKFNQINSNLNRKMAITPFNPVLVNKVIIVDQNGGLTPSGKAIGSDTFTSGNTRASTIATEKGTENYVTNTIQGKEDSSNKVQSVSDSESETQYPSIKCMTTYAADKQRSYSKTESDNKYVQKSEVDDELSSLSENPVQNKVVKAAIDALDLGEDYIKRTDVDDDLNQASINPVQNTIITQALSNKIDTEGFFTYLDNTLSFDNEDNYFGPDDITFDHFGAPGLFIERFYDEEESTVDNPKYKYYLVYADSGYVDDTGGEYDPESSHWHRIADLSDLFENAQNKVTSILSPYYTGNSETDYPSVSAVKSYIAYQLKDYLPKVDLEFDLKTSTDAILVGDMDDQLSLTNENPVQNKVITAALNAKAASASTLSGYGITDAYTKTEVDTKISSVYKYKGSVATYQDLPSSSLTVGDVYNVETDENNYAWTGTVWDKLGGNVDLSTVEVLSNKVTSLNSSSTDTQYPSARAVYNNIQALTTTINGKESTGNRVTSVSSLSDNNHYPTAKAVWDAIQASGSGGSGNGIETFWQENNAVKTFLENSNYSSSDYSSGTSVIETYNSDTYSTNRDRSLIKTITIPTGASSIKIIDTVTGIAYKETISGANYSLTNLIPDRIYSYIFFNSSNNIVQSGSIMALGEVRMIYINDTAFNIRDLGGWKCDGGTLAYGKIIRGCEFNDDNYNVTITEEQKRYVRQFLNIRDEIDLRGNSETDGVDPSDPSDDITDTAFGDGVTYTRIPLVAYANGLNLSNSVYTANYATCIKRIAYNLKNNLPTYIHCMAGADRTGTICALIEGICGVAQTDIDKDFELTTFSKGGNTYNVRRRDGSSWSGMISHINTFSGDTFRDKILYYMLHAGVTIDEINIIRKGLINGYPHDLSEPVSPSGRLPIEYQEVEYIESSGEQTIKVPFDSSFVGAYMEMDIKRISTPSVSRSLMGSAHSGDITISAAGGAYFGWTAAGLYEMGASQTSNITASTSNFDHVKFEWEALGSGKLTVNGTVATSRSGSTQLSYWLVFGGSTYPVSCQMKDVVFYNISGGGAKTAHLVPCYRKNDSVIGMYDIVTDTFYTNIGTGTFVKGADVTNS